MRIGHSTDIHRFAENRKLVLGGVEIPYPKWEGVNSLIILKEVGKMMRDLGYRIGNIDSLILIEKPKMAPHIEKMRHNFAEAFDCDVSRVSVKATRGEGLGFVGRQEGVLAQAVVLLVEA